VTVDFDLFLMSNLRSTETGVEGTVVWVSAGEFADAELQRGPRLMVVLGDVLAAKGLKDGVSVRLTNPPEVLGKLPGRVTQQVLKFVDRNRDVLLRHWIGEIDTGEMLELLESVWAAGTDGT
jgi:hypothetical protein